MSGPSQIGNSPGAGTGGPNSVPVDRLLYGQTPAGSNTVELYYEDSAGRKVQLTNQGTLNAGALFTGLGTQNTIAMWLSTGVVGNSPLTINSLGQLVIPSFTSATYPYTGTTQIPGATLEQAIAYLSTKVNDLERRYRLVLKTLASNPLTAPSIQSFAPYLASAEVGIALGTN